MARETKVGLIVGLGVILFVSVMLSEYFIDEVPNEADAASYANTNFHGSTTNQPPMPEAEETEVANDPLDPQQLAAVSLNRYERRDGPPPVIEPDLPVGQPPIRFGPDNLTTSNRIETPAAIDLERRGASRILDNPIDYGSADRNHQLSPQQVGTLRNIEPGDDILRVPIEIESLTPPQPQQIRHTVKAGDTLTKIARKYYDGDINMWRAIRDANPGLVGPGGKVLVGAQLVIPKRSTQAGETLVAITGTPGNANTPQRQRVRMVIVKEGDSLSAIASKHLGSAGAWRKIMAVNEELEKPEHITPGMQIRIPVDDPDEVRELAERALEQSTPEPTEPPTVGATYTVKPGDNLYRIAARELGDGERYKEIYEANREQLSSPNAIAPGMKLKLPAR